ncbi:hypothetical protein BVG19_g1393 [[Candida] boidinii]|nr:hypothetical protein BVG19_g1393 [[Candida] boidinii]OWB50892.1 hypothetical protein B5S27_g2445 [[Candida] boidinii]
MSENMLDIDEEPDYFQQFQPSVDDFEALKLIGKMKEYKEKNRLYPTDRSLDWLIRKYVKGQDIEFIDRAEFLKTSNIQSSEFDQNGDKGKNIACDIGTQSVDNSDLFSFSNKISSAETLLTPIWKTLDYFGYKKKGEPSITLIAPELLKMGHHLDLAQTFRKEAISQLIAYASTMSDFTARDILIEYIYILNNEFQMQDQLGPRLKEVYFTLMLVQCREQRYKDNQKDQIKKYRKLQKAELKKKAMYEEEKKSYGLTNSLKKTGLKTTNIDTEDILANENKALCKSATCYDEYFINKAIKVNLRDALYNYSRIVCHQSEKLRNNSKYFYTYCDVMAKLINIEIKKVEYYDNRNNIQFNMINKSAILDIEKTKKDIEGINDDKNTGSDFSIEDEADFDQNLGYSFDSDLPKKENLKIEVEDKHVDNVSNKNSNIATTIDVGPPVGNNKRSDKAEAERVNYSKNDDILRNISDNISRDKENNDGNNNNNNSNHNFHNENNEAYHSMKPPVATTVVFNDLNISDLPSNNWSN